MENGIEEEDEESDYSGDDDDELEVENASVAPGVGPQNPFAIQPENPNPFALDNNAADEAPEV